MMRVPVFATALSAFVGLAAAMPAEATPIPTPSVQRNTDVQQARVVIKYGYWRGHRGYRARRPGYRLYNGFWYPPAAFGPVIVVKPHKRWGWCGPRHHRYRCVIRY